MLDCEYISIHTFFDIKEDHMCLNALGRKERSDEDTSTDVGINEKNHDGYTLEDMSADLQATCDEAWYQMKLHAHDLQRQSQGDCSDNNGGKEQREHEHTSDGTWSDSDGASDISLT